MKNPLLCLFFVLLTYVAVGQSDLSPRLRNLMQRAENYRMQLNYAKAIETYTEVVRYKSDCHEAMINMADSYFKLKDYENTIVWYDSALHYKMLSSLQGFQYTNTLLMLGENEKARQWLNTFLQTQPDDTLAKEKLAGLENADIFYKDSSRYTIRNLPLNTPGSEFSPVLYHQGIILVSSAVSVRTTAGKTDNYLDLFYYNFTDVDSSSILHSLGTPINTKLHEGPATLYDGETKMIFTRNHRTKKSGRQTHDAIHFQLFYTEKDEQGQWKEPKLLSINDPTYSTGHPTITSNGQILYFSSNMEGGFGGSDLYKSTWLNNEWSRPENLGPGINTSGNEMFPYIFNDSILYFASDGYQGLGGLDIYKTTLESPTVILNLGYPINSRKDDFSISIYPDEKKGFFASGREGGKGSDDIYEFIVKEEIETFTSAEKVEILPVKVFYTIQILALHNPKLVSHAFMKKLKGVVRHRGKDGLYRYTYGVYEGPHDALLMLQNIRSMGYDDAFIRTIDMYSELSEAPGEDTDALYEKMARDRK